MRVYPRLAQHVDCCLCLVKEFFPQMHRKIWVHAYQSGDEVCLERLDHPLGCVASVHTCRNDLEGDVHTLEAVLHILGALVIEYPILWCKSSLCQMLYDADDVGVEFEGSFLFLMDVRRWRLYRSRRIS